MSYSLVLVKGNFVFFCKYSFLRLALMCVTFLAATVVYAQQPFITTWKTDNPGFIPSTTSITIPTTGSGYNYEVDWDNDGTYDQSGIVGNVTHDFGVEGTYTIRIRGDFPRIYFNGTGDRQKLLSIGQWGDLSWTSMESAFKGCANLNIIATDLPDLSGVASMASMFQSCISLNGPANIGNWNTSNVTDMQSMFSQASAFNQPIGNWTTANVTFMNDMFSFASTFNQPIGNWNTGLVVNMTKMFSFATAFNQPIGNWNTAGVADMSGMFSRATAFNQFIGGWSLNSEVDLANMLDNSGMDCAHYSAALIGWNNNPATPNDLQIGAVGRNYGLDAALAARLNLSNVKGWGFKGDFPSGMNCAPLPVVLISFTGKSQENEVWLTWQTSSETNNAGFEIEKSADAKAFAKIGFVDGNEDSKVVKAYRFVDSDPLPTTYYRLKQLDREVERQDGKFEYSRIISVKRTEERFVIYPNPASNTFYLKGIDKEQKLVVRDAGGKVVHKQLWSPGKAVKVNYLPAGAYFISVAGQTKRVIVQR